MKQSIYYLAYEPKDTDSPWKVLIIDQRVIVERKEFFKIADFVKDARSYRTARKLVKMLDGSIVPLAKLSLKNLAHG